MGRCCALRAPVFSLFLISVLAGCANGGSGGTGGSGSAECTAGTVVCDGNVAKTCDGKGGFKDETDCADQACEEGAGCGPCAPESGSCNAGVGKACGPDGRFFTFACDEAQGLECAPDGCKGACSPAVLGRSYTGCEYWPTVTMNGVFEDSFAFTIAVASTSADTTKITIEGPDFAFETDLMPYGVKTLELPWVLSLKGGSFMLGADGLLKSVVPTENMQGKAYHLRSDRPIAAYQFNPFEYQNTAPPASCPTGSFGGCFSFSADASLLLPQNALTQSYFVAGYRTVFTGDLLAITATRDATLVTLHAGPHVHSMSGAGVDLAPNETASLTMNAGDVVQVFTRGTSTSQTWSGSTVTASAPVQVIAGAPCATIPDTTIACDHLEEAVLPSETLGREYVVTVPRTPSGLAGTPHGGEHVVRIHGVHDGTTLSFDPPAISAKTAINRGDVVEILGVVEDFVVKADNAFAVTHYMIGQGDASKPENGGAGAGDPSQSIAIPSEQFRKDYTFVTPVSFDTSFVNVIAPTGAAVEVDGTILSGADFSPIGAGEKGVARLQLMKTPYHHATSTESFGIVVYGYGQYTSYMYPGGLDLRKIEDPVPE